MNPQPTGMSRADIESVARQFAAKVGYKAGRALDGVVAKLGGKILVQNNLSDGELKVEKGGAFAIYLSPYTGRTRDRFTVAHELGHFVLHSHLGEKAIRIERSGSNELEAEANCFAAALLMPEPEFREAVKRLGVDRAIAAEFDVSPDAVRVRRQVLGLKNGE